MTLLRFDLGQNVRAKGFEPLGKIIKTMLEENGYLVEFPGIPVQFLKDDQLSWPDYLTPNDAGIESEPETCYARIAALLEITDEINEYNFHGEGLADMDAFRYRILTKLREQGYTITKDKKDRWIVNGVFVTNYYSQHKIK